MISPDRTRHKPGTVILSTDTIFLFLSGEEGAALSLFCYPEDRDTSFERTWANSHVVSTDHVVFEPDEEGEKL